MRKTRRTYWHGSTCNLIYFAEKFQVNALGKCWPLNAQHLFYTRITGWCLQPNVVGRFVFNPPPPKDSCCLRISTMSTNVLWYAYHYITPENTIKIHALAHFFTPHSCFPQYCILLHVVTRTTYTVFVCKSTKKGTRQRQCKHIQRPQQTFTD